MRPVSVRIMHPEAAVEAGPLVRWLAEARAQRAERHRRGFLAAGADDARVVSGPPDGLPFGARLRTAAVTGHRGGLVVLGSGAVPLATSGDRRAFVMAAGADDRRALANNRYSADIVAIARAWEVLPAVPDLSSDNALPRWLQETAGYAVSDLAGRWRLAVDLDSPLDLILMGAAGTGTGSGDGAPVDLAPVRDRMTAFRATAAAPRAEVLVAGRTSATTLAWLERHSRSRTRALMEERGLRSAVAGQRPPASVLGMLLEHDGPGSLGGHVARLADAAAIDSRVLLAHRSGPDEASWPCAEDRFASDLLCPAAIADPWLKALTAAALEAPVPILLGGHSLVGPGLRLLLRSRPARA